ncbi:hypothetical protein SCLCIDRAFT_22635 [Scleroderma citrinum Foug A]|uniref:Uncharacterized protein n=1 Tax=Scleroderma citrinum Foug A TaxID=1036808 RepID=A0A0C2ZVC3_9AGAM|nr:hypothetical protein SCLCIDRAFT_22635 [Scleroderma citrinum Foug A]
MVFESMEVADLKKGKDEWVPFCDEDEWELAQLLMKNLGQTKTDELLKLSFMQKSGISFKNTRSFLKCVDSLYAGPGWICQTIDVEGDVVGENGTKKRETLKLWRRDPVECVEELIGNPALREMVAYVPEHADADAKGENRIYDEMWMGEWWWETQGKLPDGAVVVPVILSSNKTSLSVFSGDKKAWPVYLTIGNISKDIQRQVSVHATILIGYLPVSKLECFHKKTWSLAGYCLFHYAMSLLLHLLVDAGHEGKAMVCMDSFMRQVHPILAAYVANFPEQCLVACNKESHCPCCLVETQNLGEPEEYTYCNMVDMLRTLRHRQRNNQSKRFNKEGLRKVFEPFWKELPFTDIFTCITPDILHQLHKGIFHDHLVQWCLGVIGEKEMDARFQAVSQYPGLHHFKKGILVILQWTGTEHKEMERVFIGLLSGVAKDHVLLIARSLLNFITYAQFQQYTDNTLAAMQDSLNLFHVHKDILKELEIREHFNVPKIHSLVHYVSSIRALSSADSYNTEYPEHLHIDYAKNAYRSTSMDTIHGSSGGGIDSSETGSEVGEGLGEGAGDNIDDLAVQQLSVKAHYKVAKSPSQRAVSIQQLQTDYKAPDFLVALKLFLDSRMTQDEVVFPKESDQFDVFNQLYVTSGPSVVTGHNRSWQKIRAKPKVATRGCKPESPARFDTMFVWDKGHQPRDFIRPDVIHVTQVCVIFKLPVHLGLYLHPLVYIEWFTLLRCCDPISGHFIVSRSTRNHRRNASVISVDQIACPCHLQAQCGRKISSDWLANNVLEMASTFLINSYIDLDTFVALHD